MSKKEIVERRIIAIGDWLDSKNEDCIDFVTIDDEDIQFRFKKPSARDSMIMMEFVNQEITPEQRNKEITISDIQGSPENFSKILRFDYLFSALSISSCVYHPRMDKEIKVWESMDDVLDNCDSKLFEALKRKIEGKKIILQNIEARK